MDKELKTSIPEIENNSACVIILSDKSSGSSILQNVLGQHAFISRICDERFNFESKYWEYCAAILELPQPNMNYSHEFPIKKQKAIQSLNELCKTANVTFTLGENPTKIELFQGWTLLAKKTNPFF